MAWKALAIVEVGVDVEVEDRSSEVAAFELSPAHLLRHALFWQGRQQFRDLGKESGRQFRRILDSLFHEIKGRGFDLRAYVSPGWRPPFGILMAFVRVLMKEYRVP